MIRGLYIATSGMISNERAQEVISNNIANANTVGYKSDTSITRSFSEELLMRMGDDPKTSPGGPKTLGMLSFGSVMDEVLPRYVQGTLIDSDNPYAKAIIDAPADPKQLNRRSYFPVLAGGETKYTRDGDFNIQSGTAFLVTSAGDPVVPIDEKTGKSIPTLRVHVQRTEGNDYDFNVNGVKYRFDYVNEQGQAYTGQDLAPKFGILDIVDSSKLNKFGDTYFRGGEEAAADPGSKIVHGQVEQSNVDLASSMVSMMNVMRSYEANQKMIRTLDSTMEKAVQIGRLG